jgi:type IV pilus biogenesis protein CpaD/CtpE
MSNFKRAPLISGVAVLVAVTLAGCASAPPRTNVTAAERKHCTEYAHRVMVRAQDPGIQTVAFLLSPLSAIEANTDAGKARNKAALYNRCIAAPQDHPAPKAAQK